jgi:hypothetical protein
MFVSDKGSSFKVYMISYSVTQGIQRSSHIEVDKTMLIRDTSLYFIVLHQEAAIRRRFRDFELFSFLLTYYPQSRSRNLSDIRLLLRQISVNV